MRRPARGTRVIGSQARRLQLLRLCTIAAEMAKLGDVRTTLRRVVESATSVTSACAAHLVVVDDRAKTTWSIANPPPRRADAPGLGLMLARTPAGRAALRARRRVVIDRADRDRRAVPLLRDLLSSGAVAYVPILGTARALGLLILVTAGPHRWSRDELRLSRHLASFAAVALENDRLLSRLAEAEARFRSLIEHIPAIIYVCEVEPPYRTTYVSPQTETLFGYSPREWLEDPGFYMRIVHPDDMGKIIALDQAARRGDGFARSVYRLIDGRGAIRWVRDESVLVRDPSGQPIAWHGVVVEITGMKSIDRDGPHARSAPGPAPRAPDSGSSEA